MLLPNKIFSYNESILSKFPLVLKELSNSPQSVVSLYFKIRHLVSDVSEYIEILDSLYALQKIEYDEDREVLKYVS
jgi:hypothetical protein